MNSGSYYADKSQEAEESRLTLGTNEGEKGTCMDMAGQKEEQGPLA